MQEWLCRALWARVATISCTATAKALAPLVLVLRWRAAAGLAHRELILWEAALRTLTLTLSVTLHPWEVQEHTNSVVAQRRLWVRSFVAGLTPPPSLPQLCRPSPSQN